MFRRNILEQCFKMFKLIEFSCLLLIVWLIATGTCPSLSKDGIKDEDSEVTAYENYGDVTEDCEQDLPNRCPLLSNVLNSLTICSINNKEDLKKTCEDLLKDIKCIDDYAYVCPEIRQQFFFGQIYTEMKEVIQNMCANSEYQDAFLQHASCVQAISKEYDQCRETYVVTLKSVDKQRNWTAITGVTVSAEESRRTICCAFQEYLNCSEQTVRYFCGDKSAVFMSTFIKRMFSNIIKNFCGDYYEKYCDAPPGKITPLCESELWP